MSQKIVALLALIAALAAVLIAYAMKLPDVAVFLGVLGIVAQSFRASLLDNVNVKAAGESAHPGPLPGSTPPAIPRASSSGIVLCDDCRKKIADQVKSDLEIP